METIFLIVLFGLLFDYTNGFHDAANVVSTVIATKALAPLSAIVMASALNFLGATQISGVAETIAAGLIDPAASTQQIVLAAVLGAIGWNLLTWYFGLPSSSSYALIGGLVGAAWTHASHHIVLWNGVIYKVLLPMVLSPLVGFCVGLLAMRCLSFCKQERALFRHLQIGSACFVALSHGLNDAQKSMGIITLGLYSGGFLSSMHIPLWVIFACATVMGLGTATGGFRIIRTMGFSITKIQPVQGFAAETSSALVILGASLFGMPVSSTHIIAGGITGVGAAKGKQAVSWGVLKKISYAWLFTLPGAGLMSALIQKILNLISS